MNYPLLSPFEAADMQGEAFYTAYPLREWAVIKKIRQHISAGTCGELCSLRFTWQKPKQDASDEQTFLYRTLPWLLDAAWLLADSALKSLHIERIPGKNNLFALAMFENETAVEIEMNESLPASMPSTYFVKANFTHGHLTNQPIVGHFNEEGAVLADDSGMQRIVIENSEWDDCGDEIEICRRNMMRAIKKGAYPKGALHSAEIIKAINEALS
jgi:hypothetical protein